MLFTFGIAQSASAMETEVMLNQDLAMKGGVTPGDGPGFPITITQPGRYVLTSNLYPAANEIGIEIKVHDVTLDFNGFRLHGSGQASDGIRGDVFDTATIMNGVIAGFNGLAINGHNFWIVENMRVLANTVGIKLGDFARVQKSTITINQGFGINCGEGCHVEGNVISRNYEGVHINSGTVLGNTITHNQFLGIAAAGASSKIGFGNNTLMLNNVGGLLALGGNNHAQVYGYGVALTPLQPNACSPAC
jgi:parallel beta-helix repeat protein